MTWEIAVGIFALVGFVTSIGAFIFKLSGMLTKLQATLDALNSVLDELKKSNNDDHKYFREKLEELERRLIEVEIRHSM
jgi:uncharacterized coiled-coil protein SlyX